MAETSRLCPSLRFFMTKHRGRRADSLSRSCAAWRVLRELVNQWLRLHHHFDGFTFVHCAVAIRHLIQTDHAIKDAAGLNFSIEHVGQELVDVGANWRRAAADG